MKNMMKILVIIICLLLNNCSANERSDYSDPENDVQRYEEIEHEPTPFDDFEAKYTDADWNAFLEDPSSFERDIMDLYHYASEFTHTKENPFEYWRPGDNEYNFWTKEVTLFQRKMILYGIVQHIEPTDGEPYTYYKFFGLDCYTQNPAEDYAFAQTLAQHVLDTYKGDDEMILVDINGHAELYDLMRLLRSDTPTSFILSIADPSIRYIRYIRFQNTDPRLPYSGYASFFI